MIKFNESTQDIIDRASELMQYDPSDDESSYRQLVIDMSTRLGQLDVIVALTKQSQKNNIGFHLINGYPEEPGLYLYQPPGTFGIRLVDVSWSTEGAKELVETYGDHKPAVRNYKGNWYQVKGQWHDVRTDK